MSSSPTTSLPHMLRESMNILFYFWLPIYVLLSCVSWPFPNPLPWSSVGFPSAGRTLGMFEILSLVSSTVCLLNHLYRSLPDIVPLPTELRRCTPNGEPCTSPPPTPAIFRASHLMATNPHPSSAASSHKGAIACSPPLSSSPVSTGHAFTSTYSLRFRAGANDNTSCPCSTPGAPESHMARHVILDCR
jgi:hypothetical protein